MMIKCAKCGYENQLGTIFCRSCGAKLEMAGGTQPDLNAAAAEQDKKAKAESIKKAISSVIMLFILVAVIVCICLLLFPVNMPEYQAEKADYKDVISSLENHSETTITPAQLTAYFNEQLLGYGDGSGELSKKDQKTAAANRKNYQVDHVQFFIEDGKLVVRVYSNLIGIKVIYSAVGEFDDDEKDNLGFKFEKVVAGRLPVPGFMAKSVFSKFDGIFKSRPIREALKNAKVDIHDDSLEFSYEED